MLKRLVRFCIFTALISFTYWSNGQEDGKSLLLSAYDISLSTPRGWSSEYSQAHDQIGWLIRSREDSVENRVSFEIRVGVGPAKHPDKSGLERLQNDFKDLKKMNSTVKQIAGEGISVITYSFDAGTFSDKPGCLAQAILKHGGILVELRWYGNAERLTRAAPEVDAILASVKWLHADWKASDSQRAFLQAAQQVTAGIAPVTGLVPQYEQAVSLDPQNTKARILLGLGYLSSGRLDDAFAQDEAVSRLDPSNPQAWGGMGNVAARRGDNATALKYYATAVDRAPTDDTAQGDLAFGLVLAHRYEEALAHAELAKRLGWTNIPSLDYLIKTLKFQINQNGTQK